MTEILKMYIGGEWVLAESGATRDVLNPANGSVIAVAADGDETDARKAIAAAKTAFYDEGWWETPAAERARLLFNVANALEARKDEFALIDTLDNGKPLRETAFDASDAVACFRYFAGIATK